jgi:hypothetical protein
MIWKNRINLMAKIAVTQLIMMTIPQTICSKCPEKSQVDSAQICNLEKYRNYPTDPTVQMEFARFLKSGDSVRSIYKKIIMNEKAPDSIRADAYFRLACISYMGSNYIKAATYSESAMKLYKNDGYERLYARSSLLSKRDSGATTVKPLKTDSVKTVSDTIKKNTTAFFVQVAAFAERENAQGLQKDLLRFSGKVLIKEGMVNGKNIFRVRFGPFLQRKEAQALGDSVLAKNKIVFKIIEE